MVKYCSILSGFFLPIASSSSMLVMTMVANQWMVMSLNQCINSTKRYVHYSFGLSNLYTFSLILLNTISCNEFVHAYTQLREFISSIWVEIETKWLYSSEWGAHYKLVKSPSHLKCQLTGLNCWLSLGIRWIQNRPEWGDEIIA